MSKLALFGGKKAVVTSFSSRWPGYTETDAKEIYDLVLKDLTFDYKLGDIISNFEEDFCSYHNMKHSLSVNSGTSALLSAYFGLGIGTGDEVICPTYTFITSVTPLFLLNAVPILCDASLTDSNIDVDKIESLISSKTKAISVTHLWGHPVDMDKILNIANKYNLKIIEDCSHAHGATYNNKKVGTFGDVSVFSVGSYKTITGGMGGILMTDSQEIYDRACLLGHFRPRSKMTVKTEFYKKFHTTGFGGNLRITPIAAKLAHNKFKQIDDLIHNKKENFEQLNKGISNLPGIQVPKTKLNCTRGSWYGYKLLYYPEKLKGLKKDVFIKALNAEGVLLKNPDSPPLHNLALFQTTDDKLYNYNSMNNYNGLSRPVYKDGDLPISEEIFERSISLSAQYFHVREEELMSQYIEAFHKVINNYQELL